MRLVIGIVLLLLGLGTLSCRIGGDEPAQPPAPQPVTWVRTVHGWERPDRWSLAEPSPNRPGLHPLVVAAGQGLLSALALVACSSALGSVRARR